MKPFMRTLAILAVVAAPLAGTPVLAQSVHSAPNGDYALSTQPAHQLAPHWYEYHNWRSQNAYHTRLALHQKLERKQNGSYSASAAQPAQNGSMTASNTPLVQEYHNWRTEPGIHMLREMNRNEG